MAVFRIQENVPDVYVRKSRDFQLICNTYDAIQGCLKYDINSMTDTLDTRLCNERLLPLLQTKLGFFTKKNVTNAELRAVLQSFMYVVRDKGSRTGIQDAIEVFLKIAGASNRSEVRITNAYISADGVVDNKRPCNTYIVEVAIEGSYIDTTLLTEILRYVLPAGYGLEYSFFTINENVTITDVSDKVQILFVNRSDNDGVVLTEKDSNGNYYNMQFLPTAKQLLELPNNELLTYVDDSIYIEGYSYEPNYYINVGGKYLIDNNTQNANKRYIHGTSFKYEPIKVDIEENEDYKVYNPSYKSNTFYRMIDDNEYELIDSEDLYQRIADNDGIVYRKVDLEVYVPIKTKYNSGHGVSTTQLFDNSLKTFEEQGRYPSNVTVIPEE